MNLKKKEDFVKKLPSSVSINNKDIGIEIIFLNKKNASVIFKDGVLVFRFPKFILNSDLERVFYQLLDNMKVKLEKNLNLIEERDNFLEVLREKKYFKFNGCVFCLNFVDGLRFSFSEKNNTFNIPKVVDDLSVIEKYVSKILIYLFSEEFSNYVKELNRETYNFPINSVVIKNSKSKWGHCTSKNDIMLNVKLLNASKEQLDYVIFHEISHIKHKNHSKEFWSEVSRFCPDYREVKKSFRRNAPKIFKF